MNTLEVVSVEDPLLYLPTVALGGWIYDEVPKELTPVLELARGASAIAHINDRLVLLAVAVSDTIETCLLGLYSVVDDIAEDHETTFTGPIENLGDESYGFNVIYDDDPDETIIGNIYLFKRDCVMCIVMCYDETGDNNEADTLLWANAVDDLIYVEEVYVANIDTSQMMNEMMNMMVMVMMMGMMMKMIGGAIEGTTS